MDSKQSLAYVEKLWDESIVPALVRYIAIPNKSPAFDPEWKAHGHMDAAVALIEAWCREHGPEDMQLEVVRLGERTPVIVMEIPGSLDDSVLLYGHLDKQPEMTGWEQGLGPWKPVLRDGKLYGRGGADDGYAAFASIAAIGALAQQGIEHARFVILIEACEESGSTDLPHYIEHLAERIGQPSLVVCLDSGAGNYDQLWSTTSLRGLAAGTLTVEVLSEGVHSGDASGIVPSSFRIARQLLTRLEHPVTGEIVPAEFHAEIPAGRIAEAKASAAVLGSAVWDKFPFTPGTQPLCDDGMQLVLNRTWRPALSVTGAAGLPAIADAGNVLRPMTALQLSLRLPPTVDADAASAHLKKFLEADPPYGARVHFKPETPGSGWNAPPLAAWLEKALHAASEEHYGEPAALMGEGGSIPFMGMLGKRFPEAQFVITGVLGPHSNAHGPNEFLHVPYAKRLTACIAHVLFEHAAQIGD